VAVADAAPAMIAAISGVVALAMVWDIARADMMAEKVGAGRPAVAEFAEPEMAV
jgi:hypothetical protein